MDRRPNYSYPRRSKPLPNYVEDDEDDDDVVLGNEFDDSDDDGGDDVDDEDYNSRRRRHHHGANHLNRHPRKQRRLDSCNYQFVPRSNAASTGDWSEVTTNVLLDIWGDRFLQLGRSSLRNEDWSDVAERVSDSTGMKFSVLDCRNRLNALKSRYNREKAKVEALGGGASKWVFFKKMDVLMTMSPRQLQQQEQCGLACGVDSGEFVFMNPRVYLEHSNALDEMRDSPGNSESEGEDDSNDEEDDVEEEESYRLLSESVKKVGEIYEKIEDSKRQHMMELERMRSEFQRELESQKKEMIDRTRAEVAKLSQGEDEDSGCSAENVV